MVPDAAVQAAIAPALDAARAQREQKLGVVVAAPIKRAQKIESPLGNLFADLMRAARPGADVALTNGGGLRADCRPGRSPMASVRGRAVRQPLRHHPGHRSRAHQAVARNLERDNGIVSLSGVRAEARVQDGALTVTLRRADGVRSPPRPA